MPYDWGGRDQTPSTGGAGTGSNSDRMREHQRARSVFDIRGLGNSTLDDIGNWISRQLGLYEGMPTGDEEFSGKAAWGFDPMGLAVGLAGNALGIPGLGLVADYLSEEWGRPIGINLGTDVFGTDNTPAAPYARGASSPQVALERAIERMGGTGGYGARSAGGGSNMANILDVIARRQDNRAPTATPKPTPKPTTPAEPVLTPGQKNKKALEPQLNDVIARSRLAMRQEAVARGLDPDAFENLYSRQIANMTSGLPGWKTRTAADISGMFPTGSAPGVFDREQTRLRNLYGGQLAGIAPEGYANSVIRSDMDDAIIDRILGEQRTTATSGIENAFKRGNLTESGRTAAMGELGKQEATGRSRLNELGDTNLATYRTAINEMLADARGRAGGYTLGQPAFNVGQVQAGINDKLNALRGGLEGDVRRVAPTDLFSLDQLLNAGGVAQQAQNATRDPVIDALAERSRKVGTSRGLGTQGAF